jgi:hypothetical protein
VGAFWSMRGAREGDEGVAGKEDCFRRAPSPPWTVTIGVAAWIVIALLMIGLSVVFYPSLYRRMSVHGRTEMG